MQKKLTATKLNEMAQYATQEEIEAIKELSTYVMTGNLAVMIGAGPGVFALALLEDHPEPPTLVIIDNNNHQWIDAHLRASKVDMRAVDYVLDDSSTTGFVWQGGKIELLIVDGDHSYEGVSRDLEAWLPHVASGGYVFMHDYLEREDGFQGTGAWKTGPVAQACAEYFDLQGWDEWQPQRDLGISIVYRKK